MAGEIEMERIKDVLENELNLDIPVVMVKNNNKYKRQH